MSGVGDHPLHYKTNKMEILSVNFKTSNLGKPSNAKLKAIADFLLYTLPAYSIALAALEPVSPGFTLWSVTILNVIVITLKGLTKFTAEPTPTV
jgi:hypothetical protein